MKEIKSELPLEIYKKSMELMAIAKRASAKVLEENKRLGVPTPFAIKGKIYYLMPDGSIEEKKEGVSVWDR